MSLSHSLDNDNEIKVYLQEINQTLGQRLGSLEDSIYSKSQDSDNIMAYLEEINQTVRERLGSLEDSIDTCNLRLSHNIGDFFNPGDNCSHILHYHPQATSGTVFF